ncbi:alpha-acetolactate decarboxylase [Polychaeton citri CBS 116435]|uniref:Alpha-acetolactate decarboxylase n=1 Tax=Polychaeton citri CBS 116435 TaxID=1314669 RepID=A0A9P4US88_9PEZI|nr:alpha-acetolactate decarboxylase [Polychaeton citri CBS 116435]
MLNGSNEICDGNGTDRVAPEERQHHTPHQVLDSSSVKGCLMKLFSLLNALMDGVCETGITAEKLLRKGNQGLGTFARMQGELIMLENKVFLLQSGGDVQEVGSDVQISFAISTMFVPQRTEKVDLMGKDNISATLHAFHKNTTNLYLTYRITGRFAFLKCRILRGQEFKGQSLSGIGKNQSVETYEDVEGTIVGFHTPENWQGFGVAGEHLHFLGKDCKAGGHVLNITALGVTIAMAVASNVHVELPTTEDFKTARLVTDDTGLKEVEG